MKNHWLQQRTVRLQKQREAEDAKKFWDEFNTHMAMKKSGGNPKYQKAIKAETFKIDMTYEKWKILNQSQKNVIHLNGSKRQLLNSIANAQEKKSQEKPKNYQEAVQMFDTAKKEIAERNEEAKTVKQEAAKTFMSNDHFQKALSDFLTSNPRDCIAAAEVTKCFEILADSILKVFGPKLFPARERDSALQECVLVAWEKLPRYSKLTTGQSKAFNFFTTVMLGHLRGIYQAKKRLTNPAE